MANATLTTTTAPKAIVEIGTLDAMGVYDLELVQVDDLTDGLEARYAAAYPGCLIVITPIGTDEEF